MYSRRAGYYPSFYEGKKKTNLCIQVVICYHHQCKHLWRKTRVVRLQDQKPLILSGQLVQWLALWLLDLLLYIWSKENGKPLQLLNHKWKCIAPSKTERRWADAVSVPPLYAMYKKQISSDGVQKRRVHWLMQFLIWHLSTIHFRQH